MKQVLTLCFMLLSMFSFSQSENSVLKLVYNGFNQATQKHSFSLINLVNCSVSTQIYNNGSTSEKTLSSKQTYTINVSGTQYQTVTVKARVKDNVSCVSNEVYTWITLNSVIVLPIKFGAITARRVDLNTIKYTFEADEDNTIDHYDVQISLDGGKTFTKYSSILSNKIPGKKTYEIIIKNKP